MKPRYVFLIFLILGLFLFPSQAEAHCPLCTGALGAGAAAAKYYGLDESIIGVLIGAFGVSIGLWIARSIKKEYFRFQSAAIVLLSFILTLLPLLGISKESIYLPIFITGGPGTILNKVYWINKTLFGGIIGGIATIFAFWLHIYIKKINGKVLFPYQGIAFSVAILLLVSTSLYFIFH